MGKAIGPLCFAVSQPNLYEFVFRAARAADCVRSWGLCIENGGFPEEEPVNIALDFIADGYVLHGEGVIRWSQENQMGIELTYVADKSLARVVQLTEGNRAFIPRTTARDYQALAG